MDNMEKMLNYKHPAVNAIKITEVDNQAACSKKIVKSVH